MKRHAWQVVLILLGVLVAMFGIAWWGLQSRATAVFEKHQERARVLMATLRARPWPRAVLFEPVKAGDGWNDYDQALIAFEAIPEAEAEELRTIQSEPEFEPDLVAIEEFFEKYAPLVERLREGQRRTGFVPRYPYETGSNMLLPNISRAIRTARILSARATHFHDSGRRSEALDSLGMGMGVGHDTARGGVIVNLLVQCVCEGIEAAALRELLVNHDFKAAELERFAGQLDRLLETRPAMGDVLDADEACLMTSLTEWGLAGTPSLPLGQVTSLSSWRYLYSERLTCAGAIGDLSRMFEAARSASLLEPHLRSRAYLTATSGLKIGRNPMTAALHPAMDRIIQRDSVGLLELTMMRVSVAIARFELDHGALPQRLEDLAPRYLKRVPVCPLTGQALGYKDGKVWSVGMNGVDDGGKPGKDDSIDAADGDYVWRISRRQK